MLYLQLCDNNYSYCLHRRITIPHRVNVLRVCGELPAKYSLTVESTADFSVHRTVQTIFEKLVDQPKSVTSVLGTKRELFLLANELTIIITSRLSLENRTRRCYKKKKPVRILIIFVFWFFVFLAHIKHAFTQLHTAEPNTGDHGKKLLQLYSSFMPLSSRTENELDKINRHSIVPKVRET